MWTLAQAYKHLCPEYCKKEAFIVPSRQVVTQNTSIHKHAHKHVLFYTLLDQPVTRTIEHIKKDCLHNIGVTTNTGYHWEVGPETEPTRNKESFCNRAARIFWKSQRNTNKKSNNTNSHIQTHCAYKQKLNTHPNTSKANKQCKLLCKLLWLFFLVVVAMAAAHDGTATWRGRSEGARYGPGPEGPGGPGPQAHGKLMQNHVKRNTRLIMIF